MTNTVPWIRVFLAPALTVIAFVWTIAVSPHTKYGDNWALYPVFVAFLACSVFTRRLSFAARYDQP